ncbi:MAG: hypothetical protein OEY79_01785, partial [Anaplasmataceae bacterium]|nr:hypothetical protein [Anaplasmataceae bacterium]
IVKGVNLRKIKDKSKASQLTNKCVFIEKEQGIDISNVVYYDYNNKSTEKIGFRYDADRKKERYIKSNLQSIVSS